MGLDMYAYVATKAESRSKDTEPRELAYWRKHPNLHGWFEQLWLSKGGSNADSAQAMNFNGVELELTWEDLDKLEQAVNEGSLPATSGFFFGDDADVFYKQRDLDFIQAARAELFLGLKVFYNSSW